MKILSLLFFCCINLSLISQPDPVYSVKVQLNTYLNGEILKEKEQTHTFIFDGQGQVLVKKNHLKSLRLADRDIGENYKYTSYEYKAGKIWKERTQFVAVSGKRFPQSTRTFIHKNGRLVEIREELSPDSVLNYHFIRYDEKGRKKQIDWLYVAYNLQSQSTDFTSFDTLTYSFQWDELGRCQVISAQSSLEFSKSGRTMTLRSYQNGYLDQDFQLEMDEQKRPLQSSFEARSNYRNEERTFDYSAPGGLLHSVNCRSEIFAGGYSAKRQNIARSSYRFSYSDEFKDVPTKLLQVINKHLWEEFLPEREDWQIYWP